jgi:putative transcriptional regulator
MKQQPITKSTELHKVTVGSALIAQPFLPEEIYKRAVILIISHDENRTRGIIINKAGNTTIRSAFPGIAAEDSIYFGGPLAHKIITCIHCIDNIPGSDYLVPGISICGDTEYILEMMEKDEINLENIKFCAGVVEWNAGELNHELSEKKWWLTKISCHEVFNLPPEILWTNMLMQMENLYGFTAQLPDPSAN